MDEMVWIFMPSRRQQRDCNLVFLLVFEKLCKNTKNKNQNTHCVVLDNSVNHS